jgi:hypothetical protein
MPPLSPPHSENIGDRKISYEKSAMTVSLKLGGGGGGSGGGGVEVAKLEEAFISNVPVSAETPSLLDSRSTAAPTSPPTLPTVHKPVWCTVHIYTSHCVLLYVHMHIDKHQSARSGRSKETVLKRVDKKRSCFFSDIMFSLKYLCCAFPLIAFVYPLACYVYFPIPFRLTTLYRSVFLLSVPLKAPTM